jgi:hypothetical protein
VAKPAVKKARTVKKASATKGKNAKPVPKN